MSDFEYNIHDVQKIKTVYNDLLAEESTGLLIGLATTVLVGAGLKRFTYLRPFSLSLASVIVGSQTYGFYTHRARSYYAVVASEVNGNASKTLNECLNY